MAAPQELIDGLWRWTGRHPEWHPGEFGTEVGSYAAVAGDDLLVIDPLVPEGDEADAVIDRLAQGRTVHVLITVGFHVRSAERLCSKHGAALHGPADAARRLQDPSILHVHEPGVAGPAGVVPFAFGKPARSERPLWIPSHRAVVFGDMVVRNPAGDLAAWDARTPRTPERLAFYRDTFMPTFAPLLELPVEHLLTTHGAPEIGGGVEALRQVAASEPWFFMD